MLTERDSNRPIVHAKYNRRCRCVVVRFGMYDAETASERSADAELLFAYVKSASDASAYHLEVTSSDPRLRRHDVQAAIVGAYNEVFHELFGVLNANFRVTPELVW